MLIFKWYFKTQKMVNNLKDITIKFALDLHIHWVGDKVVLMEKKVLNNKITQIVNFLINI